MTDPSTTRVPLVGEHFDGTVITTDHTYGMAYQQYAIDVSRAEYEDTFVLSNGVDPYDNQVDVTAEALIAIIIDQTRYGDSDNAISAREHLRKASMYLRDLKKEAAAND